MKNYQDVINNRFDTEEDTSDSIYSPYHPIGKYLRKTLFKGLNCFLLKYSNDNRVLNTKKLLDVGCGNGGMLDFFISKGFSAQNTVGIDLSQSRINKAKKQCDGVTFILADILTFNFTEHKFDLITAFDLFSHLNTKEQIIQGLSNIYDHLEDDGVFLWYDIYSKDHFAARENSDSWGFNKKQMFCFSKESGFNVVYNESFFKNFFNRFHSIYQVKRLSPVIVRFLEIILPGMPGNIMIVLKKNNINEKKTVPNSALLQAGFWTKMK